MRIASVSPLLLLAACTFAVDDTTADFSASTESLVLVCYDGKPCTQDRLVSGTAGNFCVYEPLPGGTPCKTATCSGTCFPPRLEEDGSVTPGNCHCQSW